MKERHTLTINCTEETYKYFHEMLEKINSEIGIPVSKSLFIDYCIKTADPKTFILESLCHVKGKKRLRNE